MKPIAENYTIVKRSDDPQKQHLYTPSVLSLKNGRLLVSMDISDKSGEIYASDDNGKTWQLKGTGNFHHARLFLDGDTVYLIGHNGDLIVYVSHDNGESWSDGSLLTSGELWHQSACNVWYKDEYIYLVMERRIEDPDARFPYWCPNILAPVVLRGKLGHDLTKRENWLFSKEIRFRDIMPDEDMLDWFGVPFFTTDLKRDGRPGTVSTDKYRECFDYETNKEGIEFFAQPIGWLETNIVQITDPRHYWYDQSGKTLHLFMRGHTAGSGYCCVAKAVEHTEKGEDYITVEPVTVPSGKKVLFLPMPGGQMKFYIKYDEKSKLYWLLSTQATDTMCRIECLDDERYNIPCDERDRLTLHFSKNMVDWVFAGLVDKGASPKQSRHYGSMDIDGDDLVIVSRSGDSDAFNAHSGNLITFHRVKNFRDLIY